jgi:hypothetical protein
VFKLASARIRAEAILYDLSLQEREIIWARDCSTTNGKFAQDAKCRFNDSLETTCSPSLERTTGSRVKLCHRPYRAIPKRGPPGQLLTEPAQPVRPAEPLQPQPNPNNIPLSKLQPIAFKIQVRASSKSQPKRFRLINSALANSVWR